MGYIFRNIRKGLFFALFFVFLYEILLEIWHRGEVYFLDWALVRLFLGAVLVSLGYSVSSVIYLVKGMSDWARAGIQMAAGTVFFCCTAYVCRWFIPGNNSFNVLLVLGQLLMAFGYLLVEYFYYAKLADDVNRQLDQRK